MAVFWGLNQGRIQFQSNSGGSGQDSFLHWLLLGGQTWFLDTFICFFFLWDAYVLLASPWSSSPSGNWLHQHEQLREQVKPFYQLISEGTSYYVLFISRESLVPAPPQREKIIQDMTTKKQKSLELIKNRRGSRDNIIQNPRQKRISKSDKSQHGGVSALQPKVAMQLNQLGVLLVVGGKARIMGTMGSLRKMVLEAKTGTGLQMTDWGKSKEAGAQAHCELDSVGEQGRFCDWLSQ